MGPPTLFDKSFLQSLSEEESVFFDHFFHAVVCPIFYVETLADLDKTVRENRTPEDEVGIIASKFPEMHGTPCLHHAQLAAHSLAGGNVPMTGEIPRAEGRNINVDGKRGVIFEPTLEAEAFRRWHKHDFWEVERKFAHTWRAALNSIDLRTVAAGMRAMGINPQNCKSLAEARRLADNLCRDYDRTGSIVRLAAITLSIPDQFHIHILRQWAGCDRPSLHEFAPYAAFVFATEIFFQIALAANLISTDRVSNRTDAAYLAYLPFSIVFVSSDKLHRKCAGHFLRENQSFVWGPDLKADLQKLCQHYRHLPQEELEKGLLSFARFPPQGIDSLVYDIWAKHSDMSRRDKPHYKKGDLPRQVEQAIESVVNRFREAPAATSEDSTEQIDMLSVEHEIQKRKGSWWQIPKDIPAEEGH
jgi:hypothetical protein